MDKIIKQLVEKQKWCRIASYTFIASIVLLYLTNFFLRAFVYHDGILKLLNDFFLPLCLVTSIYAIDWKNDYSTKLIHTYIPKLKMLVFCVPVWAILLSFLSYEPGNDTVDFSISIYAMTAIYMTPYILRNVQNSCIAIVIETVVFVILAAKLKNNTAAIVTIAITALTLLCCLPKLEWFNLRERHIRVKVTVAVITLITALLLTLLIEETGVLKAFVISSFGRPGLGLSSFVNQQCKEVLTTAKIVGGVAAGYNTKDVFSNRVLTLILADAGWLAVIPLILALLFMIISGIYLCRRSIAIQYYISVSFLAVIVVQTAGYVLTCFAYDQLLFPQICPFLDGEYDVNSLFLLMAVCILPPKQVSYKDLLSGLDLEEEDIFVSNV